MNKQTFIVIFFVLIFSTVVSSISAQNTATKDATGSVTLVDDTEIKESIRQRIQEAVNKDDSKQQPYIKALVGKLESVTDQSLTLLINGLTELVSITPETEIVDDDNEQLSVEDLEIDGAIIAISDSSPNSLLSANRIIVLDELPTKTIKKPTLATIVKVDARLRQIELLTKPSFETLTLESNRSSVLFGIQGQDEIELSDLNSGDSILAIYEPNANENILLKLQLLSANSASTSANLDEDL